MYSSENTTETKTNERNRYSVEMSSRESIHTGLLKEIIFHIYQVY